MRYNEEQYIQEIKVLQKAATLHANYSIEQYKKVIEALHNLEEEKNSLETKVAMRTSSLKNATNEAKKVNKELTKTTSKLRQNVAFFESFKQAADKASLVTKSDLKGNITYANNDFCRVSGYTKEEVSGKPHNIIRHPSTNPAIFQDLWETITHKKSWKGTLQNKKKDGSSYWVDTTISPILDDSGNIVEYIAIRHEITELINQRINLKKNLETDHLTGCKNRFKLLQDIKKLTTPALALINVDSFSEINDFYGNPFGDAVIIELAKVLQDFLKEETHAQIYRLHGDEFAILFNHPKKARTTRIVSKLTDTISSTDFIIKDEEISLRLTTSLSFEKNIDNLFATADMMMKSAKKNKKHLLVYEKSLTLDKLYETNITWTNKLKKAIHQDRLLPFYQPIVNNITQKVEKYESLVRLIDEDGTVISPFFFLDIAKKTKYYSDLTRIVILKSFETFKNLNTVFSVNLTIKDILDPQMRNYIYSMIEQYDIGDRIVFEIVESEGIESFEEVIDFIHSVKMYGCKIAIDDFGTGYSNFKYLLKVKADFIKLDGSLIKDIDSNKDVEMVVETVIDFAKKMNIKTIAEYVENEAVYNKVKEMGIDYSQGYYFSEPIKEITVTPSGT